MKKISIINACTDLGIKINGAKLGPIAITKDLKLKNISKNYVVESANNKNSDIEAYCNNKDDINYFVEEFNKLLLNMHELHFEEKMGKNEKNLYFQKMNNLVLAVKALDNKNEKRNLKEINELNQKLYNIITDVIKNDEFPLLVGGDHVVAIASSLASINAHKNLGIIWFDSHADYNTYLTSVTGNLHGCPLAVATHYEKDILADFYNGPFYNPKNTVIVGGRDIDPWEYSNVKKAGVTVFSTDDIKKYGADIICKKAFEIATAGTNGVHISFDLDLIDPSVAPGVSVPAKNGINLDETYCLVNEIIKYKNNIKSADLVEYNPLFDKDEVTAKIAKNILNMFIKNF